MIPINKPVDPPKVLQTSGVKERDTLCDAFDLSPADFINGTKSLEFQSSIYGHADVKSALILAQFGKCAFCESSITHISYGDVEHYRPKGGYKQKDGDQLQKPGYYWLAYDWSNLFFACQICNQRHKKNHFPLKKTTRRAKCHHDDIAKEDPLLISPTEDASQWIGFRGQYAFPIRNSKRGKTTIEVLGLNRMS